jgi:hypothetical protein
MPKATLDNLTALSDGWASLVIVLFDRDKAQATIDPDEEIFELAIKKIQADDFLHSLEDGFIWSKGEFFFKIKRSKEAKGDLALKISPLITDNLIDNQYFFLVRGKGFKQPLQCPVMASKLARRKEAGAQGGAGASTGSDISLNDESDPEIEAPKAPEPPPEPIRAVLTNYLGDQGPPGSALLTLTRATQPLGLKVTSELAKVSVVDPLTNSPGPPTDGRVLASEPLRLVILIPPELARELAGGTYYLTLDLGGGSVLADFPADSSNLAPPPEPEPEPVPAPEPEPPIPELPPLAYLQNDLSMPGGWALFTVQERSPNPQIRPEVTDYQISAMDPETSQFLAFAGRGFGWAPEEYFAGSPFVAFENGALTLRVIPGLAAMLPQKSPLVFTVRWPGGQLYNLLADTAGIAPPPPPEPEPKKKSKTGRTVGIILLILALLAAGGFLYWKYFYKKGGGEPPGEPGQTEPLEPEEAGAGGDKTPRAGDGGGEPGPSDSGDDAGDAGPAGEGGDDTPEPPAPPTAVETAEKLITSGGSMEQLIKAWEEYSRGSTEDSVDASYRLVQTLSKYLPEFKVRLGEYFDPLAQGQAPAYIKKNAWTAYQHYQEADKQGFPRAKTLMDALKAWSASSAAAGQPGQAQVSSAP